MLAREGWQLCRQHFGPEIYFSYPTQTQAVSVTGSHCELNCAHCSGYYLKGMKPLQALKEGAVKAGSLLISGGCTKEGRVPVADYIDQIQKLKHNRRYNIHVGLVDDADIEKIAAVADKVSFDFIGDSSTIREVLGLDRTVEEYAACYKRLKESCQVVPHICIGLHGGEIRGEYQAIKLLQELGATAVTFIVFTPTKGTPLANCKPPSLQEVIAVLVAARKAFTAIPLQLGCMRPGGRYRQELDLWAVRSGINGIVNPVPAAVRMAGQLGLNSKRREECCVL
ncbi:hypothetical protein P22_1313 [Propionispora sp. 2/2-37]|nr:hypothetical protein P22_1313 [Propionispora sp. 2/2-37]